jgi:hypothetical protein
VDVSCKETTNVPCCGISVSQQTVMRQSSRPRAGAHKRYAPSALARRKART